jgi:hypothetical protein
MECERHERELERTVAPDGTPRLACFDCLDELEASTAAVTLI